MFGLSTWFTGPSVPENNGEKSQIVGFFYIDISHL